MGLRGRVLLAVIVVAGLAVGFLSIVLPKHMVHTLDEIDRNAALDDLQRLESALDEEFARLTSLAVGSGATADVRAIATSPGAVTPSPVLDQVDLVTLAVADADGNLAGGFTSTGSLDDFALWESLADTTAGTALATGTVARGTAAALGDTWIVVVVPLRDELSQGATVGVAVRLDQSRLTGFGLSLPTTPVQSPGAPAEDLVIEGTDVTAAVALPSLDGEPRQLTFTRPRDARAIGERSVMLVTWVHVVSGILGAIVFIAWLNRAVVGRVRRLRHEVQFVDSDELQPVTVDDRDDEIRAVADSINDMLQRVRNGREELAKRNDELHEANAVRDAFVSMVSHELRTPLTSVLGFQETLLVRWPRLDDDARLDLLRRAQGHAQTLEGLVVDLLALRAAEADLDGTIALDDAVTRIVEALPETAREAVHWTPGGAEGGHVWCTEEGVRQVLTNLLTNATKYGKPPIEVRTSTTDDHAVLVVADHGPGVPVEFHDRLFEPFAQASKGDRRTAQGVGLGLSIVQMLVDAVDGEVEHAPTPGGGATFTVRWRRVEPDPTEPALHAMAEVVTTGRPIASS